MTATLRKTARPLHEFTDAEAGDVYAWAEANETEHALAGAYVNVLVALGTMMDVDPKDLAPYCTAPRGSSKARTAEYLVNGVMNPLYDLRLVLGHAVLAEMAKS